MLPRERPLVVNAADEEQVKLSGTKQENRRKRLLEDLARVALSPEGARVLCHIVALCGVRRFGFEANPNALYFSEGQRAVGLQIMDEVASATGKENFFSEYEEND